MRFYDFANLLLRAIFRVVLKPDLKGLENVPAQGPLLVVMNHTSFLDPLLVGAYMPRHIVMMHKAELSRKPVFGALVKAYGAFPVQRGELDLSAVRKGKEVLEGGEALLMAPEGTRSKDGRLQRAKDGPALLAMWTGTPILLVAISGPKKFWHNLARLRRTPIRMRIAPPFTLGGGGTRPHRQALREGTREMMYRLAALLPREVRGVYAELPRAYRIYEME